MRETLTLFVLALLATTALAGGGSAVKAAGGPVDTAVSTGYAAVKPMLYGYAKLSVGPQSRYVKSGDTAVYEVMLADRHPALKCASDKNEKCVGMEYNYRISVLGLPFGLDYPSEVSVQAGGTKSFKLAVKTGGMDVLDEEAEVSAGVASSTSAAQKILAARPYRFTVSAESGDAYAVDNAVLYVGRSFMPNPPAVPGEETVVKLHAGWNIISVPGAGRPVLNAVDSVSEDTQAISEESAAEIESLPSRHPRKHFFIYLKDEKRYVAFSEALKTMGAAQFRRYLLHNAFWVYTPEDGELVFNVWRFTSYNGMPVTAGWNFIPATRDMKGVSLGEIKNSCEFTRLYMWDGSKQSWYGIGEDHVFDDDEKHSGIVAKAEGDCKLGSEVSPQAPVPPALPD